MIKAFALRADGEGSRLAEFGGRFRWKPQFRKGGWGERNLKQFNVHQRSRFYLEGQKRKCPGLKERTKVPTFRIAFRRTARLANQNLVRRSDTTSFDE